MSDVNDARRPLVVELIGPAGAGKSAVAERLCAHADVVRASVWNLPPGLVLESAVRSLPLLFLFCCQARTVPRETLKQIIRLNALYLFVQRRVGHARLVVLDEGPVFALSWLMVFGHPRLQDGRVEAWRRQTYSAWATALDRLVTLKATAPILTARIRKRRKDDDVFRRMTGPQVLDVIARYGEAVDRVLSGFVTAGAAAPLELAAADASPERLSQIVLATLEGSARG